MSGTDSSASSRLKTMAEGESKPRAMVVEGDDKIRAVTAEVLRREQFEVHSGKDGGDVLRLAKELAPALLMLDVSLEGLDWRACVRILARCRETRPVRVVLICPPDFDRTRCDAMKADGAFAVLQRPLKRAAITETAAAALADSDAERKELEAALAKKPPVARAVESNNALLTRQVICPFHDEPVSFDRYTLRSGKIITETNFFDLTVYKSAAPGADFINYHPLAVTVCPRCWFASVHPGYFKDPNDPKAPFQALNAPTTEAIRAAVVERRGLAASLPQEFYSEKRTLAQAVTAYELAIGCSRILLERNPHTMTVELARMGNAHLRIAHLKELTDGSVEVIDGHYREAMTLLADAYSRIEGTAIFKIAYQMLALAIHFGEDRTAHQYLGMMLQLERDAATGNEERAALQRCLPRAQRAWEDREEHRSPLLAMSAAV